MHGPSGERCEHLIKDHLPFMRFLGLGLADPVPDANAIWAFREALKRAGAVDHKPVAAALKDYTAPSTPPRPWRRSRSAPGAGNTPRRSELAPRRGRGGAILCLPTEVRQLLYSTNAIEALNAKLRHAVLAKGRFPGDEAALGPLFLILNRTEKEWTMPPREWPIAKA